MNRKDERLWDMNCKRRSRRKKLNKIFRGAPRL